MMPMPSIAMRCAIKSRFSGFSARDAMPMSVKPARASLPCVSSRRNRKLIIGHVHTDHLTTRAHQLRQRIHIAPGTTAQIQNATFLQQWWTNQTATIVARHHFRMDACQQWLKPVRHLRRIAASRSFQVVGSLQLFTIIVFNDFMHDQCSYVNWDRV